VYTWLKDKYSRNKTAGRYRSSHNDQGDRSKRRRHATDAERAAMRERQPDVTLVLLPSGKRRVERRYPTDR
jgi:hypothetical protein